MSAPTPKTFQKDAVENVLQIFRHCESQLQAAEDRDSRQAATAHNGCALLEAPTGSGKTLMAALIAESFSRSSHAFDARIVWFWFTPFAGLVGQAKAALKAGFAGLRVRDLVSERRPATARSGDVFVTTWASVATRKKESRVVRSSGDDAVSIDRYIDSIRDDGFRVGVVVDEAHHGFTKATEAVRFFREVMAPDFTLLVTATPDDADVEKFKKAAGIAELHRIRVSRRDAVEAGLIKDGIQSIAFLAPDEQKELLDFGRTAIEDAWRTHGALRRTLDAARVRLTPLMLVQVGNSDRAVDDAKAKLEAVGVPEAAIAWYTAEDPNDDLLAVAKDESKEVLIFKMAVALGFDAPRAFTLVSLRGAKDPDFGIQVVGRILRVHPKLQARILDGTLHPSLRQGYVFLADAENQSGLTAAGERINALRTELSRVSPFTLVVSQGGQARVQVSNDGQAAIFPTPWVPPAWLAPEPGGVDGPHEQPPVWIGGSEGTLFRLDASSHPEAEGPGSGGAPGFRPAGERSCKIKSGIPKVYRSEQLPIETGELLRCIESQIAIDDTVFTAGLRKSIQVTRSARDIFDDEGRTDVQKIHAALSDVEVARRAQQQLFEHHHLDPRDLHAALSRRLRLEFDKRGIQATDAELERALNLIMMTFPGLVRAASRKAAAQYKTLVDAAPLPDAVFVPVGAARSALSVYGVVPADLDADERKFVEMLDADTSDTIEYWFRNDPRKPWSIAVVLPGGERYFPDFAVKVRGRTRGNGIVLVEIKGDYLLNMEGSIAKVGAEHKHYGVPLMLVREESGRFMTVRYDEKRDRNYVDQVFRIENMPGA